MVEAQRLEIQTNSVRFGTKTSRHNFLFIVAFMTETFNRTIFDIISRKLQEKVREMEQKLAKSSSSSSSKSESRLVLTLVPFIPWSEEQRLRSRVVLCSIKLLFNYRFKGILIKTKFPSLTERFVPSITVQFPSINK